MKLFDIVKLIVDLPEIGLKAGESGTIIDLHGSPPEAYEVEFVEPDGSSPWCGPLLPHQIQVLSDDERASLPRPLGWPQEEP